MDTQFLTRVREQGKLLGKREVMKYQAAIGSLMYIATCTRPDISLAVGILSQFMVAPTDYQMIAVRRVVRYLKGTIELGLMIAPQAGDTIRSTVSASDSLSYAPKVMKAFTDSDYAAAFTRRSRTGYCIYWGSTLIAWRSRKQSVVSLSTAEAELYALTDGAKELYYGVRIAAEMCMGYPF